ncbi:MAG: hypothetical protein D6732_02310 [Methanobacteriota archaeon]|nr:MAG: hypothetical protein D6732_02310 [Euryarchaeota archaeon]
MKKIFEAVNDKNNLVCQSMTYTKINLINHFTDLSIKKIRHINGNYYSILKRFREILKDELKRINSSIWLSQEPFCNKSP